MPVYVFGLGHIGLPMAVWIALHNNRVYGIDTNPNIIRDINNGSINIEEYYQDTHISQLAQNLIKQHVISISTEYKRICKESSIFVIAVGLADKKDGAIDPLTSVLDTITPTLVAGDLLLFRTTLNPGTIDKLIVPRIQSLYVPVLLAYCPETLMETRAFEELENNPVILSGMNEASFTAAESFLNSLTKAPIHRASNFKTAEMAKVIQNIYRDVNIALVNEISDAAYQLNVNVYELKSLANTHPRVAFPESGPGVGGYCLPNALGYLEGSIDQEQHPLSLMRMARKLNAERPVKIVETVRQILYEAGKPIENSTIALVGLAMKNYCADCRCSPALEMACRLSIDGAKVQAYDPLIPIQYPFQVTSLRECLQDADCLVIAAIQKGIIFNLEEIQDLMAKPILVVDTRNVFPDFPGIKVYRF